jgi:hypothetical protein
MVEGEGGRQIYQTNLKTTSKNEIGQRIITLNFNLRKS